MEFATIAQSLLRLAHQLNQMPGSKQKGAVHAEMPTHRRDNIAGVDRSSSTTAALLPAICADGARGSRFRIEEFFKLDGAESCELIVSLFDAFVVGRQ